MKPIKINLRTDIKVVEDEKEILDGYEMKFFVSFIPDFLQKHSLYAKDKNNDLKYYLNQREKYTYIGTWKTKTKEEIYTEYYYDKDNNVICYLIFAPRGQHYPSLESVMIYKKKIREVS